jgi:hypothetical protein
VKQLSLYAFCCCVIGLVALAAISYQLTSKAAEDAFHFFLSSGGISEKQAFDATRRLLVVSNVQSGALLLTSAVLIALRSTRRRSEITPS